MRFFIAALLLAFLSIPPALAAEKESTYDRVMRTNTIRCGYFNAMPYFMIDPATGKKSGIAYEYMERLGKELDLKIDWAAEVGYGDLIAALQSGKIDAFCSMLWNNPSRAKQIDFVMPLNFNVVRAYVRKGDTARFKNGLATVNDEKIRISCVDGEMTALIANADFPKAQKVCLPQLSPMADMFMNVVTDKADIIFTAPDVVADFEKTNGDKLDELKLPSPVRIFPAAVAINRGEFEFLRMLDHTTSFLHSMGFIDQVLDKYETTPPNFMRMAKPYKDKQ